MKFLFLSLVAISISVQSIFAFENNESYSSELRLYSGSFDMKPYSQFEGGCGFPSFGVGAVRNSLKDNFFSFSINGYFADKKNGHELKFYKNKNFSEKPLYVLNEKGLVHSGKLICPWKIPYSEKDLYQNKLENCGLKDSFLTYIDTARNGVEAAPTCVFMNVDNYSINKSGDYSYTIQIGDELVYLDVSQMPELKNGVAFSSHNKRAREHTKILYKNVEILQKFYSDKSFQKLTDCFEAKDFECVDKYFSKDFLAQIGKNSSICSDTEERIACSENKYLKCTPELSKKIKSIAYSYAANFISVVHALEVNKVSSVGDSISVSLSDDVDELSYMVIFDNDQILFVSIHEYRPC